MFPKDSNLLVDHCSINDASSTKEPKTVRSTLANGISSTGPGPNKSGGNEPEPDSRCAPDTLVRPRVHGKGPSYHAIALDCNADSKFAQEAEFLRVMGTT
ncbi:hypothetical protein IAQ61_011823 [Plenodomus lingam]|uniref:uncharacterized protein n=1 Tax=Leptosphaeria maculans TaxID=5022 RepID=UPI00332A2CCA|nr:hypothetical protein IAQ61_011823 [Plenodomus lingam]